MGVFAAISVANHRFLSVKDVTLPFTTLLIIQYIFMLLFGWPLHLLARRLRWRNATTYIFGLALAGGAGGGVFIGYFLSPYSPTPRPHMSDALTDVAFVLFSLAVVTFVFAAIAGIMAWFVWLVRRPDKDADLAVGVFE